MPGRLYVCPECRQIVPIAGRATSCPTVGCEGKPKPLTARAGGKRNKFNAKATWVDGIRFHSRKEARRYVTLKALEAAGEISDLKRQVEYRIAVNGVHVTTYVADATYVDKDGRFVVEDTKSTPTKKLSAYRIKKALMLAIHGVEIHEV